MPRGVGGDTDHGSTDVLGPVKIGGKAVSSTPTAVSAGQRVNAAFDLAGRLYTLIWGNTVKDGSGTSLIPLLDADGHLQIDILSGGGTDPVGLKDTGGTPINPAKEDGNLASVKTAVELIDNFISGTRGLVTEDSAAAIKTAVEVIDNFISGARGLVTEDNSASIKTAVETIDNFISGTRGLVTEDSAVAIKTAVEIMDDWDNATSDGASVSGDVAHDAADAGEPIKVGMKAIAHGSNPTAVAASDRTDWYANRHGVPWVIGGHPNIVTIEAAYTAAQTDAAIVTVGAGLKIVVTRCSFVCDNANTVDVGVRIGFGAVNTPTTTGVILSHPGVAAGSGVVEGSGAGILGVGADGEDLRITCEVPTTGSCRVIVSYFTIES